jgi:hypothetical protein
MPTVIDALVVTLGFEPKDFVNGQKAVIGSLQDTEKQATRSAAEISRRGEQGAEFFTTMKRGAVALGGVLAGLKITDFALATGKMAADLKNLSYGLGMSAKDLAVWQGAVTHIANGSAAGVTSSIQSMTTQMQKLKMTGQSELTPLFRFLGMSPTGEDGKEKSVTQMLTEMGNKLQGRDPKQATYLMQQAGLDPGMINFLLKPNATREAELAHQREQTAMTQANVDAFDKLNTAAIGLTQHFTALSEAMFVKFVPRLLESINRLDDFISVIQGKMTWRQFQEKHDPVAATLQNTQWAGHHFNMSPSERTSAGINERTGMRSEAAAANVRTGGVDFSSDSIRAPASGSASASVMEQARTFFKGKGYTDEQVAGILTNIAAESNFDPSLIHDGGTGYGLFGHRLERRDAMFRQSGTNTPSVQQQLEYFNSELNGSEMAAGNALRNAKTAAQAAYAVNMAERPLHTGRRGEQRAGAAGRFMPGAARQPPASSVGSDPYAEVRDTLDRLRTQTGAPGAVDAAANVGRVSSRLSPLSTTPANSTTTIGQITVNTKATDARGIAGAIGGALRNTLAPQANSGLA